MPYWAIIRTDPKDDHDTMISRYVVRVQSGLIFVIRVFINHYLFSVGMDPAMILGTNNGALVVWNTEQQAVDTLGHTGISLCCLEKPQRPRQLQETLPSL